jgi:hypothetical protein
MGASSASVSPRRPTRKIYTLTETLPAPPENWAEVYRRLVIRELAFDFRVGFAIEYYRTFSTPSMARVLAAHGEMLRNPKKRSYDTALILMEIIAGGFDSPRGQAALQLLIHAHDRVTADADEFRYVLLSLWVIPRRWIAAHGVRRLTPTEDAAAFRFYQELGRRMRLTMPDTAGEAISFYEQFEAGNVAWSPEAVQLFNSTIGVLAARLPRPARPLIRPIMATLVEDPQMVAALGLPPAPAVVARLVFAALWVRGKLFKPARTDTFQPGRSGHTMYPGGYTLEDLGPKLTNN